MQELMEIRTSTSNMRLYPPPTYEKWFKGHNYNWLMKNRTFGEKPSKELTEMYQKATIRHLKRQGTLIKTFMRNCNGKKSK